MTGTNFASLIREYTRTSSTSLSDDTLLLFANVIKDDFASEIIKADEDFFVVPATNDLRASDTSDIGKREYELPIDNLKIIRVEAKLDGTNWTLLTPFDITDFDKPVTDGDVTNAFSNSDAYYDIMRKSLWIYSGTVSAVTDGLKIYYVAYPSDLTTADLSGSTDLSDPSSATSSGIPRQFHELWARRVSILYKDSRSKPLPLSDMERIFDMDFREKMASIRNINVKPIHARLPDDSHLQY